MVQSTIKVLEKTLTNNRGLGRLNLQRNQMSALVYVRIKSRITESRMAVFQTFDKMDDNLDQKCCHKTLSECKN